MGESDKDDLLNFFFFNNNNINAEIFHCISLFGIFVPCRFVVRQFMVEYEKRKKYRDKKKCTHGIK